MDKEILKAATIFATKDQVFSELEGEAVVLQLSTGTYFGLNEVGAKVWSMVQKPCAYSEILSKVLEEYEVDRTQLESDLEGLLQKMMGAGLIEISYARPA
jgi:hypothetical protein